MKPEYIYLAVVWFALGVLVAAAFGATVRRMRGQLSQLARCVHCGCTDAHACPDGCAWYVVDRKLGYGVCTNCVPQ